MKEKERERLKIGREKMITNFQLPLANLAEKLPKITFFQHEMA